MGKVLPSTYNSNYYYPYVDPVTKKNKGLPIQKRVYFKYYDKGILTDDHLDKLIAGETVTLNYNDDKGNPITVTIHLEPYTTKNGYKTSIMIIDSNEPEKLSDEKMIELNAEKIVVSCYVPHGYRVFDYNQPQKIVNSLSLKKSWRTWATKQFVQEIPSETPGKTKYINYYSVSVYTSRRGKQLTFYGRYFADDEKAEMITEEKFNAARKVVADELAEKTAKAKEAWEAYKTDLDKYKQWEKDIKDRIAYGQSLRAFIESIEYLLIGDMKVEDIDKHLEALVKDKATVANFDNYVFLDNWYRRPIYEKFITQSKHDNEAIEACKAEVRRRMKIYAEYLKLREVRDILFERSKNGEIDIITSGIDVDKALDLGRFKQVKEVFKKAASSEEGLRKICYGFFTEEVDKNILKDKLLMLLKIYHDFYDFPEKDRKAIAKFIAVHRLSDYYDSISKFDDVLEELIDNSRDPKLLKPILTSVAGTPRAEATRNKSRSFERKAKLRKNIILFKPIELLTDLRDCIKEFNGSSNVAILMNIELDKDGETFIFQFFTFSDEADGSDFDGRRIQYMTKIYNFHHPERKIGFVFDNNEPEDADDENEDEEE